jgi:intein/homing endonuclease
MSGVNNINILYRILPFLRRRSALSRDYTIIGEGTKMGSGADRERKPVFINDVDRRGHTWFFGTTGVGKLASVNSLVHTPNGWRRIGDIKTGDIVHAPDGRSVNVIGVYPQGVKKLYKITFEDGRAVEAGGEHLWEIHHKHWNGKYHNGESRAGAAKPRILTTLELKAQIERNKGKFAVRLVKNIDKPKKDLPIAPYVLGVLLGDGLISRKSLLGLCCSSEDVVKRANTLLPEGVCFENRPVSPKKRDIDYFLKNSAQIKNSLVSLDLLGCRSWEKFIPEIYLESSLKDRMELIRGLLDTDGYVSKTAVIQYSTSSLKLAENIQTLVWSLGGMCYKKTKKPHYTYKGEYLQGRDNYVLTIKYPEPQDLLTRPSRVKRVSKNYQYKNTLKLGIKYIKYSREDEAVCISVDDPDGLYIMDNYVVTHNTRLISNMIVQDIERGHNVIAIDPKGDIELFEVIMQAAERAGRLEDIVFVTPIFPEFSNSIDPMGYFYMPEELVGHIISSIEAGKEPYFKNVAEEITSAIIRSFILKAQAEGARPNFSLLEVKNMMTQDELKKLRSEINSIELPESLQLAIDLDQIINSPTDYYSKISSTLRVALSKLSTGNIGKIVGATKRNHIIERLESGKKVIAVAQLGSLITRMAAFTVGKMLISTLQSFIGRVYASGKTIDPMLCIYIDEAQNVLYHGIDDLFAKARGANVAIHGFSQSMSQIWAELGKDYGNVILDNTNTKGFMKLSDTITAQLAADYFGTQRSYVPIVMGGVSASMVDKPVLKSEDFLGMPNRAFYLMTYSGFYKCRTLNAEELSLTIKFPSVPSFVSNIDKENDIYVPPEYRNKINIYDKFSR